MTAVSQLVSNFNGGINEQPDELKKPGQVRDSVNFHPDVTYGLIRRPGMEWIAELKDEDGQTIGGNGTWIEFSREQPDGDTINYIGHIADDGKVSFFKTSSGKGVPVVYLDRKLKPAESFTNKEGVEFKDFKDGYDKFYLAQPNDNPLKYITYKDNIIVANPRINPEITNNEVPPEANRYYAFVEATTFDKTRNYQLKVLNLEGTPEVRRSVTGGEIIEVDGLEGSEPANVPSCPAVGTYRSEMSSGLWKDGKLVDPTDPSDPYYREGFENAQFDFRISGTASYTDEGQPDGCDYKVTYTIISGGNKYKEGDVLYFKFPLEGEALRNQTVRIKVELDEGDVTRTFNPEGEEVIINSGDNTNDPDINTILNNLVSRTEELETPGPDGELTVDLGLEHQCKWLTTEIIGNGIYMYADTPFLVETAEWDLFNILNSEKTDNDVIPIAYVNDVARLPIECKPGFQVRIRNTFVEEDDYYVQFINRVEVDEDVVIPEPKRPLIITTSGQGFWEEIAKPYEPNRFKSKTMPHLITFDGGTFYVSRIQWERRTVGTAEQFNPSFVEDNTRITAINYFKNRLIFMTSAGTIVTSTSQDITNFFPRTALTTGASDPIDVIANNRDSVPIHDSIVTNNGLVLFGNSAQYQFFTNSDILSPQTVNVTQIASYECDPNSKPQYLNTNICFVSSPRATRMYEMTNVFDRGQVDVNERSKPIQNSFSNGFTHMSSSRIYNVLSFSKPSSTTLWMYIYFKTSSQSDQQTAWIKYEFPHKIKHHFYANDSFYVITGDSGSSFLTELNISSFGGTTDLTKTPHFRDYWHLKGTISETRRLEIASEDQWEEYKWLDGKTYYGLKYTSRIDLPTVYVNKAEQGSYQSDTTASLTLHRIKINHSPVGAYEVVINRYGKDDYRILYEKSDADNYLASDFPGNIPSYPILMEEEHTIPIYDRNTNVNLSIETDYNAPCIINSMRWEGDYTDRYYKRV